MNLTQMHERCPSSILLGVGELIGYKFIIGPRGYASIVQERNKTVYGAVWELTEIDVTTLDSYEGMAQHLYRKEVMTINHENRPMQCLVYIENSVGHLTSSEAYKDRILSGASSIELPLTYQQEIEHELTR